MIDSGNTRRYLTYAIGEIVLVVIGILIALQINNWNEKRKSKIEFRQSMLSLASEIRNDTLILQKAIRRLEIQEIASKFLIPILESEEHLVADSMAFTEAFMEMSNVVLLEVNTENWDEMKKTGLLKDFANSAVVTLIQAFYNKYLSRAKNYEGEVKSRLEMRVLKYELLEQTDFDKIRYANPPQPPSQKAFKAIFNEKRVRTLTKSIRHTSKLFQRQFRNMKDDAVDVLQVIQEEYGE
jgi:hypothetical protein